MTKIRDGIYGLCVADALGVPAECRTREDLRQHPITGMTDGGIRGQNVGFWSDDSSMTLCLAKSIAHVGFFHTHDIMERFRQWFEKGAYTPGGTCFDFGHTCAKAIHRYQRGVTPALCGSNKPEENGNGSLMRILPAAFVLYGKYGKNVAASSRAMQEIHRISALTHRHPLA
ncbi:MAG TPA: ADP-ribosylglycohydrolase family protein, partial [Candidatus Oscillibacter pullicola]|nr:ADP-ribosylglycohydrolase family protein [Candidatus Oscillibacter pullicola]